MTSSDPDVIRRQIEDTRANLSYDVDALNEKVNPSRVVDRRVTKTKNAVDNLRTRVMGNHTSGPSTMQNVQGTAHNVAGNVQGAAQNVAGNVQGAAHNVADAVQQAPGQIQAQTQGNPLAAGLIAFGVGWLVSSLLPSTEKEKQLASQAETAVKEHSQPLVEQAKQVAQDLGEELKPVAQDAVESVKSTAQESVQAVKEEGQSAAADVQGQAQQSKETVQGHAQS
jgi:gas vesicle protein